MSSHVFQLPAVSNASPSWGSAISLGPSLGRTQHLMLYNKSTTAIVEYSHDGTNVHGELDPADGTRGQTFDGYSAASIYLRIKTGSTGPASVFVKAWSGGGA